MPRVLHPNSQITQTEADDLDAKLATFVAADAGMDASENALNGLLVALQPGPPWQAVDLFGDGEAKHRDDCVRPSGRTPNAFANTPGGPPDHARSRLGHVPEDPAGRRSPTAVATLQQMIDAEAGVVSRRAAYNARNDASSGLIPAIQKVNFRLKGLAAKMRIGSVVDIWGDGRVVPGGSEVVPTGLVRFEPKEI